MYKFILWIFLMCGYHGIRHTASYVFLNYKSYKAKKAAREKALHEWMHDNGIGV